jgi:hypothetical protein
MNDLVARLEAATGPDGDLDMAIFKSLGWKEVYFGDNSRGYFVPHYKQWQHEDGRTRRALPEAVPMYTASIDAALTLVPEDWFFHISRFSLDVSEPRCDASVYRRSDRECFQSDGPTIALAICIATLRARTAMSGDKP